MKIKHFRYDVTSAGMFSDIHEHPQTQMRNLGFHWIKCEPVTVADCWWFRCDEYPKKLPEYIYKMKDDFKFSDER